MLWKVMSGTPIPFSSVSLSIVTSIASSTASSETQKIVLATRATAAILGMIALSFPSNFFEFVQKLSHPNPTMTTAIAISIGGTRAIFETCRLTFCPVLSCGVLRMSWQSHVWIHYEPVHFLFLAIWVESDGPLHPIVDLGVLLRHHRDTTANVDGCGDGRLGSSGDGLMAAGLGFPLANRELRKLVRRAPSEMFCFIFFRFAYIFTANGWDRSCCTWFAPHRVAVTSTARGERFLERKPAAGMGDEVYPLISCFSLIGDRADWIPLQVLQQQILKLRNDLLKVVAVSSSPYGVSSEHQWRQGAFFYVDVSDDRTPDRQLPPLSDDGSFGGEGSDKASPIRRRIDILSDYAACCEERHLGSDTSGRRRSGGEDKNKGFTLRQLPH
nr:hypothetical protein Iba_chr09cCG3260 [Ipomoea batatas]